MPELARFRAWKDETHGPGLELSRHFLARFFDSELTAEGWQKVAIGVFAALLSAGILGVRTYMQRYNYVTLLEPSQSLYRDFVRADVLSLAALVMAATALATALLWQNLFPAARDYLALAGLPVTTRQLFRAKFAALLLVFGAFVLATSAPPAALFAALTSCPWQDNPSGLVNAAANFGAFGGSCLFVFFSLLALHGVLLNFLPPRAFTRACAVVQGVLFIGILGALPLIGRQPASADWWPPVWFLRLREAILTGSAGPARNAVLAMLVPAVAAVLACLLSYRRYRPLLIETPPDRGSTRRSNSVLLARWIRDPHELAAFAFIGKTLVRSRTHRLVLLAYAGIAAGCIAKGALDTPRPSLRDGGLYGVFVVVAPLAASVLITVALRHLFSLPVSLPANWVFRIADGSAHRAWLAAVQRFVLWCGVVPVFAAGLPAAVAIFGWTRAAAAYTLALLAALLWVEAAFRRWRKLPFTCSYVPAKRPVLFTAALYSVAIPFLAPAGQTILYASRDFVAFTALVTLLAAILWRFRTARRKLWSECAVAYDDAPEAAVLELDLKSPNTALSTTSTASEAGPLFADTLVASRGLLPRAWADEIEEERRRPSLLFSTFVEDVRYGIRIARRNPVFSAVVVGTLTVGIGVNASIFAVVNGFALRPHVCKSPETFLRVVPKARVQNVVRLASRNEYTAYRDRSRSLRQLAAYAHFPAFIGDDNSAGMAGLAVSCNFFAVDGADRALLGRLLVPEDCTAPGAIAPAVLAESLWRSRFASEPAVLGRRIDVNGRPATVVGVAPSGTSGWTRPAGLWIPYTSQSYFEATPHADDVVWLSLAGRLAPGVSRSQARAELSILARQQDRMHPGRNTSIVTTDGSWLGELELNVTGRELMLLAFFLGAFNLVLLIACANAATLLLARGAARRRELAVRIALGAPRVRLVRALLTETLVLAAIAGAASLYLAWRVPAPLFRLVSGRVPDFPMPPDWRTFLYVAAVVVVTGVLAGIAPALESVRAGISGRLRAPRAQGALVAAQVAMSMVLLVGAGLFAQAEDRMLRGDPGWLPRQVVIAPLFFPDNTTLQTSAVRLLSIAQRVKALPGVRSVAFSEGVPLFSRVTVELRPPARVDANQPVDVYSASPAFFETLGIRLLRGREFELRASDAASVIVSESLARAFWPRQDAIGRTLPFPEGSATVVGIAGDVDPLRFGGSDNPAIYRMWRPHPFRNVMSVRFDSGVAAGAAAVRAAVREIDPSLVVLARLAQSWIDQLTEDLWNMVGLIVLLGLVAAVLATTGIYGAVSFAVNQRGRELSIRAALGAGKLDIFREVLLRGGRPVAVGLLAGLWLSAGVAAALRQGVQGSPLRLDTANPAMYCSVALLLAAAALLAMLGPARRGANSDPAQSLRCE